MFSTMWLLGLLAIVVVYLISLIYFKLSIKWCKSKVCLTGKTAIVTGANSGIGYSTTLDLAMRGCRVIMADIGDCTENRDKIIRETKNESLVAKKLDLRSFKSVRQFANEILNEEDHLNILICNAGIGTLSLDFTEDDLQTTMQVNYFSHFLLVHLLMGILEKSGPSRVIFTSSSAAYFARLDVSMLNPRPDYKAYFDVFTGGIYGSSKMALACACVSFTKHFKNRGVTFNCLHPGGTRSNIFSYAWTTEKNKLALILGLITVFYGRTWEEGAQTLIHLASSNEVERISGGFFMDCQQISKPKLMKNAQACEEIWKESIKLVKLDESELFCK